MYYRQTGLGLYMGSSGLGNLSAAEPDCPDSDTAARDALIAESKRLTGDYYSQTPAKGRGYHWHEGHPDLRAFWEDWYTRIEGLEHRPKLVRCNKGARERMQQWINDARHALQVTKRNVPGRGSMTVIDGPGIKLPLYRSRVYWVRGPYYDQKFQPVGGGAELPKPQARDLGPDPRAGEHAVPQENIRRYALIQGSSGPSRGVSPAAPTPKGPGAPGLPFELPPAVEGIWDTLTEGEVFGIPRMYLTYGFLGLVAYNFLFKKRRR